MSVERLKLRARDAQDLQVVSAVFQDSIVPVCDIAFQKDEGVFILVAQRLCHDVETREAAERICCALTIRSVRAVRSHGIDFQKSERMLDLLAIILEPEDCINLVFAGDARIKLELGAWSCAIEDFGEPWPAMCRPHHDHSVR